MTECPKLSKCPFFSDQLAQMPVFSEMLKQHFCTGDYAGCARYRVAVTGMTVPADLYPNQSDRVAKLIAQR